jgi:hypothetical protein
MGWDRLAVVISLGRGSYYLITERPATILRRVQRLGFECAGQMRCQLVGRLTGEHHGRYGQVMSADVGSSAGSLGEKEVRVPRAPGWFNGALTGLVLTSAVVAALDHGGQSPRLVDDIAWILITLAGTSLVRSYASFVAGRGQRSGDPRTFLGILGREWSLIAAGLPAVAILLVSAAARYPMLGAIRTVLGANVAILLGLGIFGARKAGHRPLQAAALGVGDGALGLLVIVANALLR